MGKKTSVPMREEVEPEPETEVFLSVAGRKISIGYLIVKSSDVAYFGEVSEDLLETLYATRKQVLEEMTDLAHEAYSELVNQGLSVIVRVSTSLSSPKAAELLQLRLQLAALEGLIENLHRELTKYGVSPK
jgi:hypothetical protein